MNLVADLRGSDRAIPNWATFLLPDADPDQENQQATSDITNYCLPLRFLERPSDWILINQ